MGIDGEDARYWGFIWFVMYICINFIFIYVCLLSLMVICAVRNDEGYNNHYFGVFSYASRIQSLR